jgi:tRNA(Ile)-lysidine synthase
VNIDELLAACSFPAAGSRVDLAVSGGADSVALALLAHEADLVATLHHVDHALRTDSASDAQLVARLAGDLEMDVRVYRVEVGPGANLESRARAARRGVLPAGTMTGHSMDDLAETVLINLMRGAGLDGLSPMVGDPTKPLIGLRRSQLLALTEGRGREYVVDPTNADTSLLRNKVRHELLGSLDEAAGRDLVPILARQAALIFEERAWLDEIGGPDALRGVGDVSCAELREWPPARLRRWLRVVLRSEDLGDGAHPPSADEVQRSMAVVRGEVVATELSGARRLSRSGGVLRLH